MKIIFLIILFMLSYTNLSNCNGKKESIEPVLYLNVDVLPRFYQHNKTIDNFINENLIWPWNFDGQGTVLLSFIVKKDGTISNIKIERSLFHACDEEAIRVAELMHKWEPGQINGKAVDVLLFLPVKFKLK